MKKILMGNHAVSYGASISRVDVIAAYPITPQTQIVEELSELCASGELDAEFLKVESEHSAMASCIGAAQTGVRAFTATSAQGLALMHELLHWASGARLPIVMANVNRAMAPGWSIWTDQNDSLSQRDTGWMQFYCESNQEVLDSIVQAYKISEQVLVPSMVILDAFVLSHTYEPVDIPDQDKIDAFLPKKLYKYRLDIKEPHAFHCLTPPDVYFELRYKLQIAMDEAKKVINDVGEEYGRIFGRHYGLVEKYHTEDAELILVTSGTSVSTARVVIDQLREKGESVGMLKIRTFRPFPLEEVQEVLSKAKKVAVMDRNISYGHGGIFSQEIKASLYHLSEDKKPKIYGYIVGLGGRDITPDVITNIIRRTQKEDKSKEIIIWEGLKS
jgi:pyruvate/2-oxoacid:ferredoxin oxidoreductase alpha subunit